MPLTPDFTLKVIHSDASITDMVAFHADLRDIEASDEGMLHPAIHTYKEVPLGGGALFPALAFINGWTLEFPAGSFVVSGGNLEATINPVAGCYVKQTQAGAYAVTAIGGGGATPAQIVDELMGRALDGLTFAEIQRIQVAALAGKVTGMDTGTPVFRGVADTKDRIIASVDAAGNRLSVTLDGAP